MPSSIQTLIEPTPIAGAATEYFVADSPTRVDQMTVSNPGPTNCDVTLYWVPASDVGATADNTVQPARTLYPGEAWNAFPFIGHTLSAGDRIWAMGSAGDQLNLMASGTVVTLA